MNKIIKLTNTDHFVFCVNSKNLGLIDVSNTETGAKRIATRDGYNEVYRRNVNTGYWVRVAVKRGNKWGIA